jgi:hypothetical protein
MFQVGICPYERIICVLDVQKREFVVVDEALFEDDEWP